MEAETSEPVLSAQAESLYRQLNDVEDRGKSRSAHELLELRQREAVLSGNDSISGWEVNRCVVSCLRARWEKLSVTCATNGRRRSGT